MSINRSASGWRDKARTGATTSTVILTLPSGFEIEARRIALANWLATGRMPQRFVTEVMKATRKGKALDGEKLAAALDGDDLLKMLEFMRDVVQSAVVSPRIVVGGTGEDEIDPSEIPAEDFQFIFAWAMAGSPDIPVETATGGVSVDALGRFPEKR